MFPTKYFCINMMCRCMYCWVVTETCFSFMFAALFLLPMIHFHFGHVMHVFMCVLCLFSCCSWFKLTVCDHCDDNILIGCFLCCTIHYPMRIFVVYCAFHVSNHIPVSASPGCFTCLSWDLAKLDSF